MLTAEACADVASLVFIAGMLLGGVICALGWVRERPLYVTVADSLAYAAAREAAVVAVNNMLLQQNDRLLKRANEAEKTVERVRGVLRELVSAMALFDANADAYRQHWETALAAARAELGEKT